MKNTTAMTLIIILISTGYILTQTTNTHIIYYLTIGALSILLARYVLKNKTKKELGQGETGSVRSRIKKKVLRKQKRKCGHPGCNMTKYLKIHHIIPRWMGGDNRISNLTYLCPNHEAQAHDPGTGKVNYQAVPKYLKVTNKR